MQIEIITPSGPIFSGEINSVTAPGVDGKFQVLNRHANLLSSLTYGVIAIADQESDHVFSCSGGILEVNNNHVIVLCEASEKKHLINLNRAEESKKRAENLLSEKNVGIDFERARASLMRAINRIQIATEK